MLATCCVLVWNGDLGLGHSPLSIHRVSDLRAQWRWREGKRGVALIVHRIQSVGLGVIPMPVRTGISSILRNRDAERRGCLFTCSDARCVFRRRSHLPASWKVQSRVLDYEFSRTSILD